MCCTQRESIGRQRARIARGRTEADSAAPLGAHPPHPWAPPRERPSANCGRAAGEGDITSDSETKRAVSTRSSGHWAGRGRAQGVPAYALRATSSIPYYSRHRGHSRSLSKRVTERRRALPSVAPGTPMKMVDHMWPIGRRVFDTSSCEAIRCTACGAGGV